MDNNIKDLHIKLDNVSLLWNKIDTKKRLRNCTAWVKENDDYVILMSYYTIVAFIDKKENKLYDVLRYVYGYTSTSAQHIRKFLKDYGNSETEYIRIV